MYQDTIAAISTPVGAGGIGIVRLSGRDARRIAEKLSPRPLADHRLIHGHVVDPETGQSVDEVLAAYMASPHSYTREDVVEINCHGGAQAVQRVLELALKCGARLANPGEFTLRAFLNGRIDLAQAEAVLDVIQARTEAGLRLAEQILSGRLSNPVRDVRSELMSALVSLTARLDFPEDEVEPSDALPILHKALQGLQELIANADAGIIYRQGVRTAIVGRPNVGKSSLLNRLLGQDRAIVTPIPGATRDTLEEVANIKGVPFVLVDTAGIAKSNAPVESLGIDRSRHAIEQADLVLFMVDASEPLTAEDDEVARLLAGKSVLLVANKRDLPAQADVSALPWKLARISALTGEGLPALEAEMAGAVLGGEAISSDALLVTNPRHKEALQRAEKRVNAAIEVLDARLPDDLATIDLTAALNALGEITGETVSEELLDSIFSRFCIGK